MITLITIYVIGVILGLGRMLATEYAINDGSIKFNPFQLLILTSWLLFVIGSYEYWRDKTHGEQFLYYGKWAHNLRYKIRYIMWKIGGNEWEENEDEEDDDIKEIVKRYKTSMLVRFYYKKIWN